MGYDFYADVMNAKWRDDLDKILRILNKKVTKYYEEEKGDDPTIYAIIDGVKECKSRTKLNKILIILKMKKMGKNFSNQQVKYRIIKRLENEI